MMTDSPFSPTGGDVTAALQAAMNATAAAGQRLVLMPGDYVCRGLALPSGLNLHLSQGAVLHPVGDYEAYRQTSVSVIAEDSDLAIFVARQARRIRIEGKGEIRAPGEAFIAGELPDMGTHLPARLRPRVMVLEDCEDIAIADITVRQSPMWTFHFIGCARLSITDVRVDNDRTMPNTDGMVIDSCRDVTIRSCTIATADDGIVLKTTRRADGTPVGPCRNILVSGSRIESYSCALKLGTESHSDFENILFEDCDIASSNRGLGIFSRDGGAVRNVIFRRIRLDCNETPDGFWGSGEAITVNLLDRRPERPAGAVENLLFEDISGRMEGAINLVADGAAGMRDVTLRRVALRQQPGRLGTGLRYDLRPSRFDLAPAKEASGRANAYVKDESGAVVGLVAYPGGMPALFASNVDGLVLEDVRFERPEAVPEGWTGEAVVLLSGQPRLW